MNDTSISLWTISIMVSLSSRYLAKRCKAACIIKCIVCIEMIQNNTKNIILFFHMTEKSVLHESISASLRERSFKQ